MLLAESTNEFSRELKMDTRYHISWGDWMIEDDNKRRDYFLNISDAEWKVVVERHLAAHKDNVRPALAWVERIQRIRVARAESRAMDAVMVAQREKKTELDMTFNVWKDMIEEPWRYGDNDWAGWLEMDDQLRNSSKRWRVDAFWQKKQDEADEESRKAFIQMLVDAKSAFDNRMATRIQAAWRGHQLRDTHPQLNCGECLVRTACRYKDNGVYLCNSCAFHWPNDEDRAPQCNFCGDELDDTSVQGFCNWLCYSKCMCGAYGHSF